MRLLIRFELKAPARIPIDHQHALQALVYRMLSASSASYAELLHGSGYAAEGDLARRCKLFTFSGLRAPAHCRRTDRYELVLSPCELEWIVCSPLNEFLMHSAVGLMASCADVDICGAKLIMGSVHMQPEPQFAHVTEFTCLSPIVVTRSRPNGTTAYLRPGDADFGEAVRANLLWKHEILFRRPPTDGALELRFDTNYLEDPARRGGTKLVNFKGICMVGALAPFTLTGSSELMKVGWECGMGGKNAIGCGMVATRGGRVHIDAAGRRERHRLRQPC